MRRISWRRVALLAPVLVAVMFVATACTKDVNATSDELACVYNGHKGHELKHVLQPGQSISTDKADEVVHIPTSNRFFMAAEDGSIRDPLAPKFYEGNAQDNVAVQVQGQVRFRFNAAKACEWYAKHGRRNLGGQANLGFNARGPEQASSGWARFLAENFGVTMNEVVSERTGFYSWPSLVYNYPENANASTGIVKGKAGQPEQLKYGKDLGRVFTLRLRDNLGGDYFCGIDVAITGPGDNGCPPMVFQVLKVRTADETLMTSRQQVEALRQQVQNEQAAARIASQSGQAEQKSQSEQLRLLKFQAQQAILQARIKNAACIVLAEHGLDCQGNRPDIVVGATGK